MNRRQVLSGVGFLAAAAITVEQGRSQSSAGIAMPSVAPPACAAVPPPSLPARLRAQDLFISNSRINPPGYMASTFPATLYWRKPAATAASPRPPS